jgi:hypothetical protein
MNEINRENTIIVFIVSPFDGCISTRTFNDNGRRDYRHVMYCFCDLLYP